MVTRHKRKLYIIARSRLLWYNIYVILVVMWIGELMENLSIDLLGLSVRTSNCLKRANIFFVSELMELTEAEMTSFKNMGAKSIQELLDLQSRIREYPNFDTWDIKHATLEVKNRDININEELMINKAFPESIGRKITSIVFTDEHGRICQDIIEIGRFALSLRTSNCLNRNNILSLQELVNMKYKDIQNIDSMGKKSLDELIECIKDHTKVYYDETIREKNVAILELYQVIKKNILEEMPGFDMLLFSETIKELLFKNDSLIVTGQDVDKIIYSEEFQLRVVNAEEILVDFENYFYSMFSSNTIVIDLSILSSRVPSLLSRPGLVESAVGSLLMKKKIEKFNSGYRLKLPNVIEWIDTLKEKQKVSVKLRLEGKTLEECGKILGVTRERVRQQVSKAFLQKCVILREDDYKYWYCEYSLDAEMMHMIFEVDDVTYRYLGIAYKQGNKNLESLCDDKNFTIHFYSNYQKYINRNSIVVGNEYVPCKREKLYQKLAQFMCSDTSMSFEDLYYHYLQLLKKNGLENNERLLFPSERAFEARLQDSQYILMKYGRKMRYYPIEEYDIEELVNGLHLEQYCNLEISSLKIFRDSAELMEEYNLIDEYELHNLLKKTENIWNPNNKYNVVLTRMPFLAFGEVDRKKQTESLLFQVAPVTAEEFGEFYEMEYGVLARTAMANMIPYVNMYYHNGMLSVDQPKLSTEEIVYMQSLLVDDFYFIDDINKMYVQKFGNENQIRMNPRSYKKLGYRVYANYIIKVSYPSAVNYFTRKFLENKFFDLKKYDTRLAYLPVSNAVLDKLRSNYDLLECGDKEYITYEHFSKVEPEMTKENLILYVDDAIAYSDRAHFFTIKYLKNHGFKSRLHELGFLDWFNAALLKNSKKIRFIRAGGEILFYQNINQATCVDFLRYILLDKVKMDIVDFLQFIEEEYGIEFSKDKVTWIIKDTEMYYDSTMEKIYKSKEYFYEEI